MGSVRMYGPVIRAIFVVGAVAATVTGVTFATLQSQQAVLANNTISSATADLRIGTSPSSFAGSRTGFNFKDLVPGGSSVPVDGHTFYLKNYGTARLTVGMSIGSTPVNSSNIDLTKVFVHVQRVDTGASQSFTLQSLIDSYVTGGQSLTDALTGGSVAQYSLRASMAADAFNGSGAELDDIDLVFSSTAIVE